MNPRIVFRITIALVSIVPGIIGVDMVRGPVSNLLAEMEEGRRERDKAIVDTHTRELSDSRIDEHYRMNHPVADDVSKFRQWDRLLFQFDSETESSRNSACS